MFGLWPVRLADDLRRAMLDEEIRKVDVWTARYRLAVVDFPAAPIDPFFNTNRPEDLAEAERLLGSPGHATRTRTAPPRGGRRTLRQRVFEPHAAARHLGLCRLGTLHDLADRLPERGGQQIRAHGLQQLLASLRRRAWRSTDRP